MDSMDVAGRSCARAEGPRQGHWRGENVLELWGKYCRDSRWAACGEAPVISGDPSRCTREQAATTDDARSIRRKDEGACRAAGEVLAWMHRATNVEYRQGPPLVRTGARMDEGGCLPSQEFWMQAQSASSGRGFCIQHHGGWAGSAKGWHHGNTARLDWLRMPQRHQLLPG